MKLLGAAVVLLAGCTSFMQRQPSKYETISVDPLHDTQGARNANEKALKSWSLGELGIAETRFKKALAADVSFGPAHNNLGKLYFETGRYYLAAWEFEYATKLVSDRPEPYNNLGLVMEAVGRLDEAIGAYGTAYVLARNNPQFIGNLARARLRRNDEDPVVRVLLGELLLVDTRPDWLHWATEQLATGDLPCPPVGIPSGTSKVQEPLGMAEVISLPLPEEPPMSQTPIIDNPNTHGP